jgi:hypothetical protein
MEDASGRQHHHCVISGFGRAGTTFLVILATRLGIDTGFTLDTARNDNPGRAGLEMAGVTAASPYLVKNPRFCHQLATALADDPALVVDCVIAPMRDIGAAAESRALEQERQTRSRSGSGEGVLGGLWLTGEPARQETVLRNELSMLIETVARHDIPLVLLWYPRLAQDPAYVFEKLGFLFKGVAYEAFERAFRATVRPEWVHRLSEQDIA